MNVGRATRFARDWFNLPGILSFDRAGLIALRQHSKSGWSESCFGRFSARFDHEKVDSSLNSFLKKYFISNYVKLEKCEFFFFKYQRRHVGASALQIAASK